MQQVTLVDSGSGNLRSAHKALVYAADMAQKPTEVTVSMDPDAVRRADRVVLPGQGAFGDVMAGLDRVEGLRAALVEAAVDRARPLLGICVGMQLFADRGLEHGEHCGLGWIPGTVARIAPDDASLKIPHMGWNALRFTDAGRRHPVLRDVHDGDHVYFVHSYAFDAVDPATVLASVDYGGDITGIVGRDTLIGMQFHPEKSQQTGLTLLAGFLSWSP